MTCYPNTTIKIYKITKIAPKDDTTYKKTTKCHTNTYDKSE